MRTRRKSAEEFCSSIPYNLNREDWKWMKCNIRVTQVPLQPVDVHFSNQLFKRFWAVMFPLLMLSLFILPFSFSQSQILQTSTAEVPSSTGSIRSLWAHSKMWFPWSSRACRGMESYSMEKDSVETTLPWKCRKESSHCTSTWVRTVRIIGAHIALTRIVSSCFYQYVIYIKQYLAISAQTSNTCCVLQGTQSLNTGQRGWEEKEKRIDLTDVMQDTW